MTEEPELVRCAITGTEGWITIPPPFWFPEQAVQHTLAQTAEVHDVVDRARLGR